MIFVFYLEQRRLPFRRSSCKGGWGRNLAEQFSICVAKSGSQKLQKQSQNLDEAMS